MGGLRRYRSEGFTGPKAPTPPRRTAGAPARIRIRAVSFKVGRRHCFPRGSTTYTYDDAGRLDQIVYPAGTGITATFRDGNTAGTGFDENGNLRFLRYEKSGLTDPLRSFEWTYDDSNNRETMLDVDPTRAVKWEYGFDWLDRLVTVKKAQAADVASLTAPTIEREYVFDESDNRVFFDDHVNGATYHYLYDEADQLEEILIYASAAGHRIVGDFTSSRNLPSRRRRQHDTSNHRGHQRRNRIPLG